MAQKYWGDGLKVFSEIVCNVLFLNKHNNCDYETKGQVNIIRSKYKGHNISVLLIPIIFFNDEGNPLTYPIINTNKETLKHFLNHEFFNRWMSIYDAINEEMRENKIPISFFITLYKDEISLKDKELQVENWLSYLIKNPDFFNIVQAIFKGEYIRVKTEDGNILQNILSLQDIINNSGVEYTKNKIECIVNFIVDKLSENDLYINLKKAYYNTFVEPYKKMRNIINNNSNNIDINIIEALFNIISRYNTKSNRHKVPLDALRTPVPFFLINTVENILYIRNNLKGKLKILWIDNNWKNEEKESLENMLKTICGNNKYEVETCSPEKFDKGKLNNFHHIIILDFFLDARDIKTANIFIENSLESSLITGLRKWIFIASRYSSSVMKYLESGALANIYNNSNVVIGDFWETNDKNMNILFIHKFSHMLKSMLSYYKSILEQVNRFLFYRSDNSNSLSLNDLIFKLRLLINNGNIIESLFGKSNIDMKTYEAIYNLMIYSKVLPSTEMDIVAEMKRKIEDKYNRKIHFKPLIDAIEKFRKNAP